MVEDPSSLVYEQQVIYERLPDYVLSANALVIKGIL